MSKLVRCLWQCLDDVPRTAIFVLALLGLWLILRMIASRLGGART